MTDHKAEAEAKIVPMSADEKRAMLSENPTMLQIAEAGQQRALVHAVLYLAEQQRIANLIAFMETEVTLWPSGCAFDVEVIRTQIVEGLGVA